ncbi:hypothetical protein [Prolixibacter sp. NT017]|uniref:hypothetical protein n=1 Tax=Prolixibacter sp. NT017 TaxID=2652390 RepID=UPI00129934F0|nr:hypothetical protein [Prolixibacter sp. NT017]
MRLLSAIGLIAVFSLMPGKPVFAQNDSAGRQMAMEFKIDFSRIELSDVPAFVSLAVKSEYRQVSISQAYKSRLPCGMVIYKLFLNVEGSTKVNYYKEDGSKYIPGRDG